MAIDLTSFPEHHKLLATPDADRLAELHIIQADLEAAHDTLTLYLERFLFAEGLGEQEKIISASLFRDAILLFCSCFSTKDPNKLEPEAVYGHLEGQEELYRRVLDTRDSFVAHNFGPLRQHNIVVICLEIGGKLVPTGITPISVRMGGWDADRTKELLSLIEVARDHIRERINLAQQPILESLETISSDELAALEDGEVSLPDNTDIRTSRARFRASGRGQRVPLPIRRYNYSIDDGPEEHRTTPAREAPDGTDPPELR